MTRVVIGGTTGRVGGAALWEAHGVSATHEHRRLYL
jgi:hypothetical protein